MTDDLGKSVEQQFAELCQKHGILRIHTDPPITTEEAIRLVNYMKPEIDAAAFPKELYPLLGIPQEDPEFF